MNVADGLKLGGGGLMLISGFLAWGEAEAGWSANAFDFFLRGTVPWVCTVGVGAITFLLVTNSMREDSAPWPLITFVTAAIATLLILVFMIDPTYGGESIDRGIGSYLGLFASATALGGAFIGLRDHRLQADDEEPEDYAAERGDAVPRRRSHPPLP